MVLIPSSLINLCWTLHALCCACCAYLQEPELGCLSQKRAVPAPCVHLLQLYPILLHSSDTPPLSLNLGLKNNQPGTLLASAECGERELLENLNRKKHGRDKQDPREERKGRKRAEFLLSVKTEQLQKELRKKKRKSSPKLEKSEGLKISEGPHLQPHLIPFVPCYPGLGHSSTLTPWCPGCCTPTQVLEPSALTGANSRNSLSCHEFRNLPLWYFNFKTKSAGDAWNQCTVASGIFLGLRLADSCFSPKS